MSPTILVQDGLRFYFYSNEHTPKHIHITSSWAELKYDLENNTIIANYWFKKIETKKIVEIINKHQTFFLEEWDKYFN